MDPDLVAWLASPDGLEAIRRADAFSAGEPLTAQQQAAVLTQVDLARQAGLVPGHWLLTRDGLEQATRPEVAARHAQHVSRVGTSVVDLGAGLGFDAAAMIAAGLRVTAVEQDPVRVAYLRVNVPQAVVVAGNVTAPELLARVLTDQEAVIFCDPGRRSTARQLDGRRAHPERDPQRWSPPWSFVLDLARCRRVVVKAAAGIPRTLIPDGWQAEWVSAQGVLLEVLLTNTGALTAERQAAVLRDGHWHQLARDEAPTLIGAEQVGAVVHQVDPAVLAADATATLAARLNGRALTEDGRWLTSDAEPEHQDCAFLRSYSVIEELPAQLPALRKALRDRGITEAVIKSRGRDQAQLRRALGLREGSGPVLAFIDNRAKGKDRKSGMPSRVLHLGLLG